MSAFVCGCDFDPHCPSNHKAAARRFLALTETGRRVEWCETHRVELKLAYAEGYDGPRECQDSPFFDGDCHIAPKLLADYLTEETE